MNYHYFDKEKGINIVISDKQYNRLNTIEQSKCKATNNKVNFILTPYDPCPNSAIVKKRFKL
jgi:hypothetical protein